jgi:uncharacterized integral membrane protein (TIGR00697 family)
MPRTRKDLVYFILGGFFLTNAILGELTGGKLFEMSFVFWGWAPLPAAVLSIGVLPWPVVFITTDLANEYFGKPGVRKLTFLAVGMIAYSFVVLYAAMQVAAWDKSPVTDAMFHGVFGQSMWIIVGSLVAFGVSQFVDMVLFHTFRRLTGQRMLWLRATGSTFISQLVDTFLIGFIAFVIPRKLGWDDWLRLGLSSYAYKVLIAIVITPIIYAAHGIIDRYLERDAVASGVQP